MTLDYNYMMALAPRVTNQVYGPRDTILYAIGVGAGLGNPTDPLELPFVYEERLSALPTMAVTLAYPGFWLKEPEHRIDWKRLLQGEQTLVLHHPVPTSGDLVGVTTVDAIFDKGPGKAALLYTSRKISDRVSGKLIATSGIGYFLRGGGGFGGTSSGAPQPHEAPDRAPDLTVQMGTRPEQALAYRLSGDLNPLHVDPAVAREAGFDRPILHGLCTYGVAARAAVRLLCDGDAGRLKRYDVRFTTPVYPGEMLEVQLWHEAPGQAALRCRAVERDLVVLEHGYVEYEV